MKTLLGLIFSFSMLLNCFGSDIEKNDEQEGHPKIVLKESSSNNNLEWVSVKAKKQGSSMYYGKWYGKLTHNNYKDCPDLEVNFKKTGSGGSYQGALYIVGWDGWKKLKKENKDFGLKYSNSSANITDSIRGEMILRNKKNPRMDEVRIPIGKFYYKDNGDRMWERPMGVVYYNAYINGRLIENYMTINFKTRSHKKYKYVIDISYNPSIRSI
jgi:hypothetical protein